MKRPYIAISAVVAVLLTGCQATPSLTPRTTTAESELPTTTATVPPDNVIAKREGTANRNAFVLEVVQFLRRDSFVELTFRVTVTKDDGSLGWQVHNFFSAQPVSNPTVDGVFLIDTKNAKKHLVAQDSEGKCVCSRIGGLFLKTDDSALLSATFAAPPPDVRAMDVHIPVVGTLANVPLS